MECSGEVISVRQVDFIFCQHRYASGNFLKAGVNLVCIHLNLVEVDNRVLRFFLNFTGMQPADNQNQKEYAGCP